VLAHRYPTVPNLGDVTTIDWRPYVGAIRFLIGGFPCQDISLAGKGAGIEEGTRSGLWMEYLRAIVELAPDGVLIENVAALRTRGLDRVLRDLHHAGYEAEWDTIPAAAFGAPHLRERMFIVAWRRGLAQHAAWPVPPLLDDWRTEPEGVERITTGVADRAGRLFVLGNAVVPQAAGYAASILRDRIEAGPTAPVLPPSQPFGFIDGDRWAAPALDLFGGADTDDVEFPPAGYMRDGQVIARERIAPQPWSKARGIDNMASTIVASFARRPTDGMIPTPTASEPGLSQTPEVWDARQERQLAKGNSAFTDTLGIAALRAPKLIPTPTASDAESSRNASAIRDGSKGGAGTGHTGSTLLDFVDPTNGGRLLLPTPRASANENRQTKASPSQLAGTHGMSLGVVAAHLDEGARLLPTPVAKEAEGGPITGSLTRLGTTGHRYSAGDHRAGQAERDAGPGGKLNPVWTEWVQGFPLGWTEVPPQA
jgi:hypothetical protein